VTTHAPSTLPNSLTWAARAACRTEDANLFFSDSDDSVAEAKRICQPCPVRAECLAEALRTEDGPRYGISGGLTPDERAQLAPTQRPDPSDLAAQYLSGASIRDIAHRSGQPYQAVRQALVKAGVQLRGRGGSDRARHGTASTYQCGGCRCEPCTKAHSASMRAYRARRRQREAMAGTGGAR
jgi:WhiB family redox-sensing transcriptional regulator